MLHCSYLEKAVHLPVTATLGSLLISGRVAPPAGEYVASQPLLRGRLLVRDLSGTKILYSL